MNFIDTFTGLSNMSNGILNVLGNTGFGMWDSFINGLLDDRNYNKMAQRSLDYWKQQMDYSQNLQHITMNKANNFAVDMWNRTNAYNSPVAQRQRMEAAGLNPNWSDGIGGEASNISSSTLSAPTAQGMDVGALLQNALMLKQMQQAERIANKEIAIKDKIADSEVKRNVADARNKDAFSVEQEAFNERIEEKVNLLLEKLGLENENIEADTHKKDEEADLASVNASYRYKEVSAFDERNKAEVDNIIASTNKLNAEEKSILAKYPYEIQALVAKALLDDETRRYIPYRAKTERITADSLAEQARFAKTYAFANLLDSFANVRDKATNNSVMLSILPYQTNMFDAIAEENYSEKSYKDTLSNWQRYYNKVMQHENMFVKDFIYDMRKKDAEIQKIIKEKEMTNTNKWHEIKRIILNDRVTGPFGIGVSN